MNHGKPFSSWEKVTELLRQHTGNPRSREQAQHLPEQTRRLLGGHSSSPGGRPGVCLAYFESKFNPSAVYENAQDGSTGFGLFQIQDRKWPSWSLHCRFSDSLEQWLDGCKL
ncbi:lysozyme-like protein 4 [Heterocephalus glaber]|uniref:lysozyme n=1 Tax=Heterocephalus glaber TaxID=10181 RepID=A0AAX6S0H8_HETGA|nr:lysozyme-like protein 4 [Heterocephalus glaber]